MNQDAAVWRWVAGIVLSMSQDQPPVDVPPRSARLRPLWLAAAYLSLALGLIGVVLPGLPTVPFVLLASCCAARGSRKLHASLRSHPRFGKMICEWEEHGTVNRRAKWLATTMMAACSVLMWFSPLPMWVWVAGSGIMLCVAVWLWFRPEPSSEG